MKTWYIYSLIDPRTSAVRYVGWCFNVGKRLRDHISRARKEISHKASWLVQLENEGLQPECRILETGNGDWAKAERRWIAAFRADGAALTNLTDGGEGVPGWKPSQEAREKMSAAKRGRKLSAEHIEKVAAAHRGKPRSKETCARMSAGRLASGYRHSDETRARLAVAATGYRHTDEAKAKISRAGQGRKHSEETIAKMAAAKKGKALSEEHKHKLSEAKRGRPLSEEHKQSIGASCRHPQRCGICGVTGHKRGTCGHAVNS